MARHAHGRAAGRRVSTRTSPRKQAAAHTEHSVATDPPHEQQQQSILTSGRGPPPFNPRLHPRRHFRREEMSQIEAERLLLTENAYSCRHGPASLRVDSNGLARRQPMEDRNCEHSFTINGVSVLMAGVFDGHQSDECAEVVRQHLHRYCATALKGVLSTTGSARLNVGRVKAALADAFVKLDADLLAAGAEPVSHAAHRAAVTGSTVLMTVLIRDRQGRWRLFAANAGDSRVVIGHRQKQPASDGDCYATELSQDLNCSNADEVARIQSEHPDDEEPPIRYDRVLGVLEPTRAMGDACFKWDGATLCRLKEGKHHPGVDRFCEMNDLDKMTPPYVTARPEVQYADVTMAPFYIIATDGLWATETSERAVRVVNNWLTNQEEQQKVDNGATALLRSAVGYSWLFDSEADIAHRHATDDITQDDVTITVVFLPAAGPLPDCADAYCYESVPIEELDLDESYVDAARKAGEVPVSEF